MNLCTVFESQRNHSENGRAPPPIRGGADIQGNLREFSEIRIIWCFSVLFRLFGVKFTNSFPRCFPIL